MNKPSTKTVLMILKVVLWIMAILMIGFGIAGIWSQRDLQKSHVLLGAGILLGIILLIWGRVAVTNIEPEKVELPKWNPQDADAYLTAVYEFVVKRAVAASNWYWGRKKSKAAFSQAIRFAAWLLAGVAGLLPILGALQVKPGTPAPANAPLLTNGLLASILVGTAAALLGLDKIFGFSSGWTRYVLTGTMIGKSLEQFRIEWAGLKARAGDTPAVEAVLPLIERAAQFLAEIQGLVLQETKEWVTEFQSNLAQMEKDIGAQLEKLKLQVEQTIKEKEAASKRGYVQLTIKDPANKFGKASLKATLIDSSNQAVTGATQLPVTSLTWPTPFVPPGFYHVKVQGTVDSAPFEETRDVTVKSGEKATPSAPDITL